MSIETDRWSGLRVGHSVEILGVRCRLVHVNLGKGRLTFTPLNARMPQGDKNPTVGVVKGRGGSHV